MDKLPKSLINNIFSFLPVKEVKKCSGVSKNQKAISDNFFNPPEKQIFYMVGQPILIGTIRMSSALASMIPREKFPLSEIRNAFPKTGVHRLFKREMDALMYSRSLRTDPNVINTDNITQPAIFKVQFLNPISENQPETRKETLTIQDYIGRAFRQPHSFDVPVEYCQARIDVILPIEGSLKIDYKDENKFKICASYTYGQPAQEKEKEKSQRCIIM